MTINTGPFAPLAVILAGGLSTRMGGGDKGLLPFGTGTVMSTIIDRIAPQSGGIALNANGDPARFAAFGLPVLPDPIDGFAGPLAGVLAAFDWGLGQGALAVVTVASDTPFVPCDLIARLLWAAEGGAPVVIAASGDNIHPTCALWSVRLRDDLATTLGRGDRKLRNFTDRHGAAVVRFSPGPPDPFFNINTPADLAIAEGWL